MTKTKGSVSRKDKYIVTIDGVEHRVSSMKAASELTGKTQGLVFDILHNNDKRRNKPDNISITPIVQ